MGVLEEYDWEIHKKAEFGLPMEIISKAIGFGQSVDQPYTEFIKRILDSFGFIKTNPGLLELLKIIYND